MSEVQKCPECKGRGFFENQCLWGDGFDYRSPCGFCKGTGIVQEEEPR